VQRAEEDWGALRDPALRGAWWDRIKYLPLGGAPNDTALPPAYLTLGGDARLYPERYTWEDFGDGTPQSDGYVLQRYMLHGDLRVAPAAPLGGRLFAQIKSGLVAGRRGPGRPPDVDTLDVHQLFVEGRVGHGGGDPPALALRVGRQEFFYGSARLLHFREGPNVRQSFDAARAIGRARGWRADAFVASPAPTNPGAFDDGLDGTRRLWGVYASGPLRAATPAAAPHADAYYIGHRRRRARFDQGTAREVRHTLGTRLWGRVAAGAGRRVDYNWEPMVQLGTFGTGDAAGRIRAWTLATETAVSWPAARLAPRLSLRADVASGDRDPADPDLETFHPLYRRGNYFGLLSPVGPANFRDLHPQAELTLWRGAVLTADWLYLWRHSPRDGTYNVVGALFRGAGGSRARFVGHQPGAQVEWEADAHTTLLVNYAVFFAGPYVRETGPARNISYLAAYAAYRF
jgi:hypothetical protein